MKDLWQGVVLFLTMIAVSVVSEADELDGVLSQHFKKAQSAEYLRYERVEELHTDEYGAYHYLVLDFDVNQPAQLDLQASVHAICSSVLKDLSLIRRLSDEGFDMISVSFDRQSQFDCL